jgi:PAS domain S-box-containing protein
MNHKSNYNCNLGKEDLKKFLDYSYDEIFVIDGQGKVVYVNEACERHYGLKPEEVIGKSVYYLSKNGYYSPLIAPFVLKEKRRVTMEQVTQYDKKLVVTATPILDKNGEIEFVVMNSRDITEIESLKHDLLETQKMLEKYRQEVYELRKNTFSYPGFIACSKKMKSCLELASRVAAVDTTVLITGESGTGKNLLASYIHNMSHRKKGPMMCINCAAIPEQLLESELFGYCRGAFTGADPHGKMGLAELADGGTLFLDEVGEIPIGLQAKLLELVEENRFIPIGGKMHKKVNIRLIAATNRNLLDLVKEGKFRKDLYYRINVIDINIPPLRERQEDIVPLLNHFLGVFDKKYNRSHTLSQELVDFLINYSWPGNVRELENLVERLVVTVPNTMILPEHLPTNIWTSVGDLSISKDKVSPYDIETYLSMKEKEKKLIIDLYKKLRSTYKVADVLKISQSKVARTIRKNMENIS